MSKSKNSWKEILSISFIILLLVLISVYLTFLKTNNKSITQENSINDYESNSNILSEEEIINLLKSSDKTSHIFNSDYYFVINPHLASEEEKNSFSFFEGLEGDLYLSRVESRNYGEIFIVNDHLEVKKVFFISTLSFS